MRRWSRGVELWGTGGDAEEEGRDWHSGVAMISPLKHCIIEGFGETKRRCAKSDPLGEPSKAKKAGIDRSGGRCMLFRPHAEKQG